MSLALSGLALLSSVSLLCTGNGAHDRAASVGAPLSMRGPAFWCRASPFLGPIWRGTPPTLQPQSTCAPRVPGHVCVLHCRVTPKTHRGRQRCNTISAWGSSPPQGRASESISSLGLSILFLWRVRSGSARASSNDATSRRVLACAF